MSRDILNINGKQPSQVSDTPRQKWTGVLGSPRRLAAPHHWSHSSGPLSPSVSRTSQFAGSRMPSGTLQGFRQDIDRRIVVSIHHQATMRTHVRAYTERLVDPLATPGTVLRGEVGCHRSHVHLVQCPIIVHPLQEPPPGGITDRLSESMIFDQVSNLQVFIGNQVVRRDQRVRCFPSEILTLPLDFQIRFGKKFSGFLAVLALLLFRRHPPMEPLELLFGLPQKARIGDFDSLRVGIECLESHVNANLFASGLMDDLPSRLHTELDEIAIGTPHDADPFDLLLWESFDLLFLIADEPQTSNAAAVREGDVASIGTQLPARDFVLDGPIIVLKLGIALLAWLLLLAILVEPRDSRPCPICTGLTSLGVETSGK